ncbi:hypothetical protein GCM10011351_01250 [Paraliobacillus quinghaiensis]|uniref:HD domain-containing protein n=1 Tax=Paraliobacillus quinghaiensis TaxID=470815 RepID=A0A917TD86_9BACI|nr:HD domain-containing phosphohydrolase [Paraliobacillus quinghaiensis]GGM19155.1 hypothetical protein GCM10011351_01250 [Paraliobacillus quinghaiensis]
MQTYRNFVRRIIRNYLIGSITAVLLVGGTFIFTTLEIPDFELSVMLAIIIVSIFIMMVSEFYVLKKDLKKIKYAILKSQHLSNQETKLAYEQAHRFPYLTVRRILLPHLLGFSIPAGAISVVCIYLDILHISYQYVIYAYIGSVLVAIMHGLVEYYLTIEAIKPVLAKMRKNAKDNHEIKLSIEGNIFITIRKTLIASALVIGVSPVLLFTLAAQIRLEEVAPGIATAYWNWAGAIVVMSMLFASLAAWLFAKSIKDPISGLHDSMQKVQAGEFTVVAHDNYSNDFSKLIDGFNQMVESLQEKDAVNQQLLESFITTLAAALDARDPYTAGHSIRVAQTAVEIGEALGLEGEDLILLRKAGLLHDIGKIDVEDSVLLKDGKLTEEEFSKIKQHPILGVNILTQVKPQAEMEKILPGVRSHHERIDGKGYPDQLEGQNIPFFGRILAVADAFDAMTSNRPYRNAMPKERAYEIIRSGAGSQWDADCVAVFLKQHGKE